MEHSLTSGDKKPQEGTSREFELEKLLIKIKEESEKNATKVAQMEAEI